MGHPDLLFQDKQTTLDSPLQRSEAVDISSSDHVFSNATRAILVTADGDIVLRLLHDPHDLTFTVSAGAFLPFRVAIVRQTGTTATAIGLW